ncbi:MAG TPA: hypothetical protein VIE46_03040 [Gemmatimonadales bacterium]
MQTRSLEVLLSGPGADPRTATIDIGLHAPAERVKRAALAFGTGVVAAAVAVLIPIVHFVLVPSALVLGIVFGVRRLGQTETFRGGTGVCPYCGTRQQLTLFGRFHLPKSLYCSACQRELYLTSVPPHSPT